MIYHTKQNKRKKAEKQALVMIHSGRVVSRIVICRLRGRLGRKRQDICRRGLEGVREQSRAEIRAYEACDDMDCVSMRVNERPWRNDCASEPSWVGVPMPESFAVRMLVTLPFLRRENFFLTMGGERTSGQWDGPYRARKRDEVNISVWWRSRG